MPGLLKQTYGAASDLFSNTPTLTQLVTAGHPPAAALFATNGRYKREAFRGSEFAPRILADAGIEVVLKVHLNVRCLPVPC